MTDKKFTDDEIIKALEVCGTDEQPCSMCPLWQICGDGRMTSTHLALDLINRQKAEALQLEEQRDMWMEKAEELKIELKTMRTAAHAYKMHYESARAEAFKEFAKKIKTDAERICDDNYIEGALIKYVDTLVKEMTETK